MMYIELENDGEFFDTLLEDISQLNHLQQQNKDEFMNKMNQLCEMLIDVVSFRNFLCVGIGIGQNFSTN